MNPRLDMIKRFGRRTAGIFAAIIAIVIVALFTGSVSIQSLSDQILPAIKARLPADTRFTVADLRLSLGVGTAIIDLRGMKLDRTGQAGITAASMKTYLGLGPLLRGDIQPVEVVIDGLSIDLGEHLLAADGKARPEIRSGNRADAIRVLATTVSKAVTTANLKLRGRGLKRISVTNIQLAGAMLTNSAPELNLPIRMSGLSWADDGEHGRFRAEIESDQGPWTVELDAGAETGNGSGGADAVSVRISGFPPSFIYSRLAEPSKRPNYDAVADVQGRIELTSAGKFNTAHFRLTFNRGHLSIMRSDRTPIDRVDMAVTLDRSGDNIQILRSEIRSGKSRVAFAAGIDLGEFGSPISFDIKLEKSRLSGLANDEPVELAAGRARGSIDIGGGRISLDNAFVSGPEGSVSLSGAFARSGDHAGLTGTVEAGEITARMIHALWPPVVAHQARNWFGENVISGLAGPGVVKIALPMENLGAGVKDRVLPPDGLVGEIPFRFGIFRPTPELPMVQRSSGIVRFGEAALTVNLLRADVPVAGLGKADVNPTIFKIPKLGRPGAVGLLDLSMSGPAAVMARLSNSGRLSIAENRGLKPESLSGAARLELFLELPLRDQIDPAEILAEFDLQLTEFASISPLGGGRMVSGGNLNIAGSMESHLISGDAVIDGVPARIDIQSGTGANSSLVRLTLDEVAQRQLGIDLAPFLTGPIVALVSPDVQDLKEITLDLTPADINLPFLGWHKIPGTPATFQANIVKSENGSELTGIAFFGEGFDIAGELAIGVEGNLISLDARHIRLRDDDRYSLSLKAVGEGWKVVVRGKTIDVRGMISALQQSSSTGTSSGKTIDLDVRVDQVLGHNGVILDDVTGTAQFGGGQVERLSITSGKTQDPFVSVTTDADEGKRKVTVRYPNAGNLLRFLNVYRTSYGGSLALNYEGSAVDGAGRGQLSMWGFRVLEGNRNISVSRLSIPFASRNNRISIFKSTMTADSLDATARGSINLESRYMSIRGTIVPTTGLNRLPASVPILGDLLGARKRKGLIGVAFTLSGPLSAPALKLNVASAVTPGIVRRLFKKK